MYNSKIQIIFQITDDLPPFQQWRRQRFPDVLTDVASPCLFRLENQDGKFVMRCSDKIHLHRVFGTSYCLIFG